MWKPVKAKQRQRHPGKHVQSFDKKCARNEHKNRPAPLLQQTGALDGHEVSRVAFDAITPKAVKSAMEAPRMLSQALVDASHARRALDYLLGFTLSPILWRKLPGPRSAGRVQSVALRLICELEAKLEVFVPRPYYSVTATLATLSGCQVWLQPD